jgi:hypothetical protein
LPIVSENYKKNKKALILKSAFECFAQKGFQVATMEDIVNHSKMSKGNPEELSLIFWGVIDGSSLHHAMLLQHYPFQNVITELKQLIYSKLKK